MYTEEISTKPRKIKNLHWWRTISWQYIVLQRMASKLMGLFTQCTYPPLKNWQIRTFIRKYGVDMQEILIEDYRNYKNFNSFFTRQLKSNARPIDSHPTGLISPADGVLSQFGSILNHSLIQAKGKYFTTQALLGESSDSPVSDFKTGYFATIYLAPKNYHRVHMPITGTLKAMRFIPGSLFSVSTNTADHIDQLFARNERLVSFFETANGPMAIVMVGAMLVSSMTTRWAGVVGSQNGQIEEVHYNDVAHPIILQKGEELGHFNMGSTVIMLMGEKIPNLNWQGGLEKNQAIQMGQLLAYYTRI